MGGRLRARRKTLEACADAAFPAIHRPRSLMRMGRPPPPQSRASSRYGKPPVNGSRRIRHDADNVAQHARRMAGRRVQEPAARRCASAPSTKKFPSTKARTRPSLMRAGTAAAACGACSRACATRFRWSPILDRDALIGLYQPEGGGAISLEPGGQFELSGAPLLDVHATQAELDAHFDALARGGASARRALSRSRLQPEMVARAKRRPCPSSATTSWRPICRRSARSAST